MLLAIAWLLASVGAGHLLVLKTYDPVAISLDTPCVVRYKFVNPSEQSVHVESFFDYTFYQSYFSIDRERIPQLPAGERLVIGPEGVRELTFNLLPQKPGTFQDLPAKSTYRVLDGLTAESLPRTVWSTVNGKMRITETRPLKSFGQREMECLSFDCRWMIFTGLAALNILAPSLHYIRLWRRLRLK